MSLMRALLITFVACVIQLALFILAGVLNLPEESVGWLVAPGVMLGNWYAARAGAIELEATLYIFIAVGLNMVINGLLMSLLIGACSRSTPATPHS